MRVLVFGASTTQGFWDTEGGWVSRLRKYYDKKIINEIPGNRNYLSFFNLGISGELTEGIADRLVAETNARLWPGEEYAFIFSTGINDSPLKKDGKPVREVAEYESQLKNIIEKAKAYSVKILFLETSVCDETKTTPIPWGTIHYTNARFELFNKSLNEVANEHGIRVIGAYDEFKNRITQGEELLKDGLHPNNAGHQLIFELVQPALDRLLNT